MTGFAILISPGHEKQDGDENQHGENYPMEASLT